MLFCIMLVNWNLKSTKQLLKNQSNQKGNTIQQNSFVPYNSASQYTLFSWIVSKFKMFCKSVLFL